MTKRFNYNAELSSTDPTKFVTSQSQNLQSKFYHVQMTYKSAALHFSIKVEGNWFFGCLEKEKPKYRNQFGLC